MNKNIKLSRELETILETSETPLEIESTPCWEWIRSKFIELAAKATTKTSRLFVEICFDNEEKPMACSLFIKDTSATEYSTDFNFSMKEVENCYQLAEKKRNQSYSNTLPLSGV